MKDRSLEWIEFIEAGTGATKSRERVVKEVGLSIFINRKHFATTMITPIMENEFVAGHLFRQRVIENITDIKSITIENNIAEVTLSEMKEKENRFPIIHSDFKVPGQDIFEGVKATLKSEIFKETGAVHSAGLFQRGAEQICIADDIGRHNALDKVIGYGLLNSIDFNNTFATSTGRLPSEMILRCCNANIPIIATKGVPTTLAIDIAKKAGFTIVGLVREDRMTIYSNPSRIE